MSDTEKDKNGSGSVGSMDDFNPVANSTLINNDENASSQPQPEGTEPKEKAEPEKYSEPPPSSVCFGDQPDKEISTRPIGPMQNSDKIVSETQDFIKNIHQMILEQRRFLVVCDYQIFSMLSIVKGHYDPLLTKIETFLTYSNGFQTEWFFQYYRLLPQYADYAFALKDRPGKVVVNEIPKSVEESTLKRLAQDVVTNMFAGGLQVKVQRSLNTEVGLKMDIRREAFELEELPLKLWIELFEVQSENAKRAEEQCFELLTYVDFLNVLMGF